MAGSAWMATHPMRKRVFYRANPYMQLRKSVILGLSVLSPAVLTAHAETDEWTQGTSNDKVEIDYGDGILHGSLQNMDKQIFLNDVLKGKSVYQYFPNSPKPGSTSKLTMNINGDSIDLQSVYNVQYYKKPQGVKAVFTKNGAEISQSLTPGPHGGILVTYSVKNTTNKPMGINVKENIDTQLDGDDNVPVKAIGGDVGVYILKAPYRLDYRTDVDHGPNQYAGRSYTSRSFTDGAGVRVTAPANTDLFTGDTGIHLYWDTTSIAPGETKSFAYEVKIAGESKIEGKITRDPNPDDTPDMANKLYPQMPLKLQLQAGFEGAPFKAPNKTLKVTLPAGMTYQGDKIAVTWPDGSNSEEPVTVNGQDVTINLSNQSKWVGSAGIVKLLGTLMADDTLDNKDVTLDVLLTSQGTSKTKIPAHIDEIPERDVTVKYVDEFGRELEPPVTEKIRKRKPYDMTPKRKPEIVNDGIEYEYFATDGNEKGVVGRDHILVTFKYRPKPAKDVVVTFKTKDGRTLQPSQNLSGKQKEPVFPQGKDSYLSAVKLIKERDGKWWSLIQPTNVPSVFTTKDQRLDLTYYLSRSTRKETIPYATEIIEDETMPEGEERVTVEPMTGEREIITHFDEAGTTIKVEERIVKHMRTKIIHKGVKHATTSIEKKPIAFTSRTVKDPTMLKGERKVVQAGQNGEKTITRTWETWRKYKIGDPTSTKEEITKEPVEEIIHIGTREDVMDVLFDVLRHKKEPHSDLDGTDGGRAHQSNYSIADGKRISEITTNSHLLRTPIDDVPGKPTEAPKPKESSPSVTLPDVTVAKPSESVVPSTDSIRPSALSILKRIQKPTIESPLQTDDTTNAIQRLFQSLKSLSVRRWK